HHEVGTAVGGVGQNYVLDRKIALGEPFHVRFDAVAREVIAHGPAGKFFALALLGDGHEVHRLGALQKRHRVTDRACGGAAAVPAGEHALEREPTFLDVGHDDDGPAGFEQRAFRHQVFHGAVLALRLADDRKIEAPGDAGEQRGGAAEGGIESLRLPGNTRLFHRRLELADGALRGFAVFLALQLDQLDRNAAERAVGNDRFVEEGDAGDLRAQRAGDGRRVVGREVLLAATRQADDDILDHVTTSSPTQRTRRDGKSMAQANPAGAIPLVQSVVGWRAGATWSLRQHQRVYARLR